MSKKIFALVLVLTVINNACCFFFDFNNFLRPLNQPQINPQPATISAFGAAQAKMAFGQATPQINTNPYNFNIFKVDVNLRKVANQVSSAKGLYEALGIAEDVILNKILPIHSEANRQLEWYFNMCPFKIFCSRLDLYNSIKKLGELIKWIEANYLSSVNSVVIGNGNVAIGSNIYIKGSYQTVVGVDNFVFNDNQKKSQIVGDNIVRIGGFDVDLDFVEYIKIDPFRCVTVLPKSK